MATAALALPDAEDLEVDDIDPRHELESANHLLDDHAALMRFHDDKGYILLRGVLDLDAIAEARAAMFAVLERHGVIAPGATEPVWTGKPFSNMEESEEFAGISRRLVEHPANAAVTARILGEPASIVPITQYRAYPPGGSVTGVHQDGFFTPGVQSYKPVWMPICPIPRALGGLMIAVGQNKSGFFHNTAKPPRSPIPTGVIDPDSWATTDYAPGDVLIIHPSSPHASRPNRSDKVRISIDTRIQSSSDPRIVRGTVTAFTPVSVTLMSDDGRERRLSVDAQTFIRILHPGTRTPFEEFGDTVKEGLAIVAVFDGDRAGVLRKASDR